MLSCVRFTFSLGLVFTLDNVAIEVHMYIVGKIKTHKMYELWQKKLCFGQLVNFLKKLFPSSLTLVHDVR